MPRANASATPAESPPTASAPTRSQTPRLKVRPMGISAPPAPVIPMDAEGDWPAVTGTTDLAYIRSLVASIPRKLSGEHLVTFGEDETRVHSA